MKPIYYAQLIGRVYDGKCKDTFTRSWFPNVSPDMTHVKIYNKQHLMRYVLHAGHSMVPKDLLTTCFGDHFGKMLTASGLP